jgi:formylglycine-generating enzyme required for sulfatase activity
MRKFLALLLVYSLGHYLLAQQIELRSGNQGFIRFRHERSGVLTLDAKDGKVWSFNPFATTRTSRMMVTVPEYLRPTLAMEDCVWFDFARSINGGVGERYGGGAMAITGELAQAPNTNPQFLPASLRFYMDTAYTKMSYDQTIWTDTIAPNVLLPYFQPFYFRKYEVTNKEYREFVYAVRDSIMRERLGYRTANGRIDYARKINYDDTAVRNKSKMFLPPGERFYARPQVDERQLNYTYVNAATGLKVTRNIYPDTTSWLTDFTFSYNEPMSNMYFWHPAYDDYPVVGVSYMQAQAYLHWKTRQLNRAWKTKGQSGTLRCTLPSERQWDLVSTVTKKEKAWQFFSDNYHDWADVSWNTDLVVYLDDKKQVTVYGTAYKKGQDKPETMYYSAQTHDPMRRYLLRHQTTPGNFTHDGAFHTSTVSFNEKAVSIDGVTIRGKHYKRNDVPELMQQHRDPYTGIYFLDGNVSEWMSDAESGWKRAFTQHQQARATPVQRQQELVWEFEKYYFEQLPAIGRLVRGANWFDERYSNIAGRNAAGTQCKTFLPEDAQHCTVGFRYVVWVE